MNATPVSKEEVRLLAIEIGVREAARRLGLNEDRVRQWSSRYAWFSKPDVQKAIVTTVTKPSEILLNDLAEHERETRLSLAKYARRAAKDSEQCSVRESPLVHKVAQIAGITYKWGENEKGSNQFTLNVLNINSLQIDDERKK